MVKLLGIDEAGRGPVIGPLVMVGFVIDEKDKEKLVELGVKDSKLLSPEKREEIAKELEKMGKAIIKIIQPWQIDAENINKLEIKVAKEIIKEANPDKVIIDGFERNLSKKIGIKDIEVIAEPKADKNYPVVSAASIIAKVIRDREIEKIKEKFGNFGSGYPSDERTVKFVKEAIKKEKKLPEFVRRKWETVKRIIENEEQKKLFDF